jgi:hypothetical protein
MSSAAASVKNIPGIEKTIPGSGENHSPSAGILFVFTPESQVG